MIVRTIIYQKEQYGKWFAGLHIENDKGTDIYLSSEGKTIKKIWQAKDATGILIDLRPILTTIEKRTI